jgi:hypothetical protein
LEPRGKSFDLARRMTGLALSVYVFEARREGQSHN